MRYPDGNEEDEDKIFDSQEAAEECSEYIISCSREGQKTYLCLLLETAL